MTQIRNEIKLLFDKSTTRLAGNPYGREVFRSQAKEKINYESLNVIIFPENIERVASSFVQGFFAEIIEKIGYSEFSNAVLIEAADKDLVENIYKDLLS